MYVAIVHSGPKRGTYTPPDECESQAIRRTGRPVSDGELSQCAFDGRAAAEQSDDQARADRCQSDETRGNRKGDIAFET